MLASENNMVSPVRQPRRIQPPKGNVAGLKRDPYIPEYSNQHLLDPGLFDSILRNEGYTNYRDHVALLDTYASLARDCHVSAVLNYRISDIIRRELLVTPHDLEDEESVRQAEFIKEVLEDLGALADEVEASEALITTGSQGFDGLVEDLLHNSILTGFGAAEIIWKKGNSSVLGESGLIVPGEVRMRKPRRFGFKLGENGYIPRLITRTDRSYGEPIPPRKFIFHHYNLMAGPYGLGLGYNIYWPVVLKRENVTFWAVFNEKFGSPTTLWKYPLDSNEDERASVEEALGNIQQDAIIGIPETFTAELLEAMRSGTVSTYESFNEWCDDQISEVVLGQTGTVNQSSDSGSRAQDEVAERVSIRIAKRDSDLLGRTLQQTIVKWTLQANLGFEPRQLPKIEWSFPELEERVDLAESSQVDERLVNMTNLRLDQEYLEEKYEVVFSDEVVQPDPVPSPAPGAPANLADPPDSLDRPIQDVADDVASQAVERSLPTLKRWDAQLTNLVNNSESYAEFQSRLFQMFTELDDGDLVQLLTQGMALSEGLGVLEVQESST